ncbi:MAG TPA: hypothetical protein VLI55_23060 [Bryobacteraceae bacterium]|nr:hypothetical protein [Bryobacteraceae bacterium]
MWLLDANMDVHLTSVLAEFGIARPPAPFKFCGHPDQLAAAALAGVPPGLPKGLGFIPDHTPGGMFDRVAYQVICGSFERALRQAGYMRGFASRSLEPA